jgi:SIR2-like domain
MEVAAPLGRGSPGVGTTLVDLLELCSLLVRDADTARDGRKPAQVLPILLAEVDRWTPVIRETFKQAGATVVVAAEFSGPTPILKLDASLVTRLDEAVDRTLAQLAAIEPASYDGLLVDRSSPQTRHVTGPAPLDAVNRAQKGVRQLLTALFSDDLVTGEYAVLIWDDSQFDEQSSTTLLALVRELPTLLGLPDGSLVILVVGDGKMRVEDHCVGESSVRYDLSPSSGLRKREALVQTRRRLAEWQLEGAADAPLRVLMLGAGASVSAGLPMANQMRNEALERRVGFSVSDGNILEAASAFRRELREAGRLISDEGTGSDERFALGLTLERVLREEQHEEHQKLCHTLRGFALQHTAVIANLKSATATRDPFRDMLACGTKLVLVTLNFDQVIETRAPGLVRPIVSEADFDSVSSALKTFGQDGGPIPLLKLHGDIDQPETLVANTDDTAGGLSKSRLRGLRALRDALGPVCLWWYVGYSMRDLDLLPVLSSPDFADGLTERWISPMLDRSVVDFLELRRLARWRMEHVDYSAEERAVSLTAEEFWKELLGLMSRASTA